MKRRWLTLLLSPLGLVLISAGRLLIISNYNATTATTIASTGGYVNTLLGSIIPLVPLFIPYVALLLLLFRQFMLSVLTFVFAAFIAPTSVTLPISRQLAAEDTYQVLDRIGTNRQITIILAFLVLIIAYLYFRSFVEALATLLVVTVAVGLLSAPIIQDLYLPSSLRSANASERTIRTSLQHDTDKAAYNLPPSAEHYIMLTIIIGLIAIIIVGNAGFAGLLLDVIPDLATLLIALMAAIAFFPYIYNIYPVPHRTEYYVGILRSPWLPAEKLSLRGGGSYYGYTLATDPDWFTVLLARTRAIVYIHTDDILRRSVCETLSQRKIPMEPPLITTFYQKPAAIRPCADRKYLRTGRRATRTRSRAPAPTVPRGHPLPGTRPFG
ncbi:MAG TPA: hypothetical protein VMH35_03385 [Streptosporangiaceae bacterium]|nr:hypothetical protein [Streptosporangiaceae bacterium]